MKFMFRRVLVCSLILLVQQNTFGQLKELKAENSYYLGKKRTVGLTTHLYPTTNPNRFSKDKAYNDGWRMITVPEIYYSIATSNNTSIQISYNRVKLYGYSETFTSRNRDRSIIWSGKVDRLQIQRNSVGFHINKHFANKGISAPVGSHFQFGLQVSIFKNQFNGASVPAILGEAPPYNLDDYAQNFVYLTLNAGYKYRSMVSENLYFDMTVLGGLPFRVTTNPYSEENYAEELEYQVFEATRNRLVVANMVSLGFGIGRVF